MYITKDSRFDIPSGIYLRYEDIHIIRKFLKSDSVIDSIYGQKKIKVPEEALRLLLEIINQMYI